MLLWVFEFNVVYSATLEMYTEVNIMVKVVCVTTVVNKEKNKKICIKKERSDIDRKVNN